MTDEEIQKYLKRICCYKKIILDIKSLSQLQKNHLLNIPFENLDIHYGKKIIIDTPKIFNKIIENKMDIHSFARGGFCYELNSLFYELLISLGFNAKLVSARVNNDDNVLGQEFDHLTIITEIDNEIWLTDVGFGEFSFAPLKIEKGLIQKDERGIFIIDDYDSNYIAVKKLTENNSYHLEYIFSLIPRQLSDFNLMCNYHQTSPNSHFTKNKICSIALHNGRITLTNEKLKIKSGEKLTEIEIKDKTDFEKKLKEYFSIAIE